MTSDNPITASQRLERSRQAIVRYMAHDEIEARGPSGSHDGSSAATDGSDSSWGVFKQVAASWWRGHPAHLALDIAKPLLQGYAAEKPLQLLGISAGLGAAAVLLRPWRLISLAGLAAGVMKSTSVSGIVQSLLSTGRRPDQVP